MCKAVHLEAVRARGLSRVGDTWKLSSADQSELITTILLKSNHQEFEVEPPLHVVARASRRRQSRTGRWAAISILISPCSSWLGWDLLPLDGLHHSVSCSARSNRRTGTGSGDDVKWELPSNSWTVSPPGPRSSISAESLVASENPSTSGPLQYPKLIGGGGAEAGVGNGEDGEGAAAGEKPKMRSPTDLLHESDLDLLRDSGAPDRDGRQRSPR
ncbi:hypothetical protein Dimus_035938 [Dionaea muscipula]